MEWNSSKQCNSPYDLCFFVHSCCTLEACYRPSSKWNANKCKRFSRCRLIVRPELNLFCRLIRLLCIFYNILGERDKSNVRAQYKILLLSYFRRLTFVCQPISISLLALASHWFLRCAVLRTHNHIDRTLQNYEIKQIARLNVAYHLLRRCCSSNGNSKNFRYPQN